MDSVKYKNYAVKLPGDKVKKLNKITFKYEYAKSPKEVYGAKDTRLLGVNFRRIKFMEEG